MKASTKEQPKEKVYQCQINIQFPAHQQALHAKEVLQVDGEIGDQITKSFEVVDSGTENGSSDVNVEKSDGGESKSENEIGNGNQDKNKSVLSM